ncbi:MAG: calcium/sodium antiporter, partial [Anaerohalosphaera sp.]|nr:calcium/sodium antiporter [Anaerohalosphaera sp.]
MIFEMNMLWACILLPMGLVILIKGADWLVDGAVGLAEKFGVSPLVIGLTIVAMGTSAPEVAASIAAAMAGSGDIAIGNVYGSNIANLALVGGICAMIRPIGVKTSMIRREIPVMVLVALLLWPILAPDMELKRFESVAMLVLFAGMIMYTVWAARREGKISPEFNAEIAKELAEHSPHGKRSLNLNTMLTVGGLLALGIGAKLALVGAVYIGDWFGLSEAVIGITILAAGTSLPELITCLVAAIKGHDDLSIGNLVGS